MAFNCAVPPAATCGPGGVTLIDAKAMTLIVACVKLMMLLPAAAEHESSAEYVPNFVSGPVETEPEPERLPCVGIPSLAVIEHCVGGNESGTGVAAGPHVSVGVAGLAEGTRPGAG